ncbi:hypothetical protein ACFUIW_33860 [Streptomyces sp. NPDC057245]|uniref:hypothetical protein n=1 Tax=unclassified Streptomyces TaxID=2593676 RepID=UPI003444066C
MTHHLGLVPTTPLAVHRIQLPLGLELMNSNDRPTIAQRARLTRELRAAGRKAALDAKVPHLERVYVTCYLQPINRQRRDPGNWYPSAKAALDGVVDAGVLDDDDSTRVIGPDMRLGQVAKPGPRLLLVITDLSGLPTDHLTLLDPLGVAA